MTTAAVVAACWTALSVAACLAMHRARNRRVLPIGPTYPACVPVPAPLTPPYSQTLPAADLFDGMPSDCLSDDAVHSLFDSIVAGEFK